MLDRIIAMLGGLMMTAGVAVPAATWVQSPGGVLPSATAPSSTRPSQAPPASSKKAMTVGHQVMRSVMTGHAVAGVVERQSSSNIWLRPLFEKKDTLLILPMAPDAVIWRGGWRFVGRTHLKHMSVDLVTRNKQVLGLLEYHDAYGRVRRRKGNWVTIQQVHGRKGSNPACRVLSGRPFRARINAGTVWNSRRYLLPRHSLVQYTVYGVPGYPFMLGGVEDYGRAPCHAAQPSVASLYRRSEVHL